LSWAGSASGDTDGEGADIEDSGGGASDVVIMAVVVVVIVVSEEDRDSDGSDRGLRAFVSSSTGCSIGSEGAVCTSMQLASTGSTSAGSALARLAPRSSPRSRWIVNNILGSLSKRKTK
jgi:hypothetical protein